LGSNYVKPQEVGVRSPVKTLGGNTQPKEESAKLSSVKLRKEAGMNQMR